MVFALPAAESGARSTIPLAGNYLARTSQTYHGRPARVQFQFHPRKVRRYGVQYVVDCDDGSQMTNTWSMDHQRTGARGGTITDKQPTRQNDIEIKGDSQRGYMLWKANTSFTYAGLRKIKGYFQITIDYYHASGEVAYHCTMPKATFTAKRIGRELHPER
jgi:hypothetical protein